MHELGTIYYVIDTVEKLMVENDLKEVGSITLEVGEVSGIIPMYLQEFWEYARQKTEHFQNTELKIEELVNKKEPGMMIPVLFCLFRLLRSRL